MAFDVEEEQEEEEGASAPAGLTLPRWSVLLAFALMLVVMGVLWWKLFGLKRAAGLQFTPTVPLPSPTFTSVVVSTPTAFPSPTPTPVPTPVGIVVGSRVEVSGTGEFGLRLRSGPGLDYVTYKILPEGSVLKVLGGPEEAGGNIWWRVEDEEEVVGWVVEGWLEPMPSAD